MSEKGWQWPNEPGIGDVFMFDGFTLKCVRNGKGRSASCRGCWFEETRHGSEPIRCFDYNCLGRLRKDRTNVRFELVKED